MLLDSKDSTIVYHLIKPLRQQLAQIGSDSVSWHSSISYLHQRQSGANRRTKQSSLSLVPVPACKEGGLAMVENPEVLVSGLGEGLEDEEL